MKKLVRLNNKRFFGKTVTLFLVMAQMALLSGCTDYSAYAPEIYQPVIDNPVENQTQSYYEESITYINSETFNKDDFGSYKDNNVTLSVDGIDYEGYFIAPDKDDAALFSLNGSSNEDNPASFYNISAINGISSININYKCDTEAVLYYGNNRNHLEYAVDLPARSDYSNEEILTIENVSYFRLLSSDDKLHVSEIEIISTGDSEDATKTYYVDGQRYVPKTNYNPQEGETLSMPVCDVDETGNVTVTEWKEYTYHSFDYCEKQIEKKGDDPSKYALTDPVDIANYFVLFEKVPANFGVKANKDGEYKTRMFIQKDVPTIEEVEDVFGDELSRVVSQYTITDGYATSVPYENYKDRDFPVYYEFDFDTDGTYDVNSRGMGRVVGWAAGFETYSDGIGVALLTDDHYFTFRESSNCGYFNDSFDGNSKGYAGRLYAPGDEVEFNAILHQPR